jgi:hypothetical protein
MSGITPEEQGRRDGHCILAITSGLAHKKLDLKFFSPMRGKNSSITESGTYGPNNSESGEWLDRYIYERDRRDVENFDVIFVRLDGAKTVSIGTVSEIAWAKLLRKLIVIVMEPGNLHEHTFILQSTPFIYPTLEEAVDELAIILQ